MQKVFDVFLIFLEGSKERILFRTSIDSKKYDIGA